MQATNDVWTWAPQLPSACFCNDAVKSWYNVLSSFHVLFRRTGRGLGMALQKHKRQR